MAIIYITSDGGKLSKQRETLKYDHEKGSRVIFPHKSDQIIITGKTLITSSALNLLMRHKIDTVFMGKNGRFSGKIDFQTGKNVFLRQKQFQKLDDQGFCLEFTRNIVIGKLKNQRHLLQRLHRKQPDILPLKRLIKLMKERIKEAEKSDHIDSLRGYEGIGAKHYFEGYRYAIYPDWVSFNGRNMHPPKDPVNAVLSFLYTMILYRVDAALEIAGLDSYVGYFHALNYGKKALTFDLIEEYRVPLADTVTAALFNLNILTPEDFRTVRFDRQDDEYPLQEADQNGQTVQELSKEGVLLTKSGIRKTLIQFEKKLETEYLHPALQKSISYRKIIPEQINLLRKVILGEESSYIPLVIK